MRRLWVLVLAPMFLSCQNPLITAPVQQKPPVSSLSPDSLTSLLSMSSPLVQVHYFVSVTKSTLSLPVDKLQLLESHLIPIIEANHLNKSQISSALIEELTSNPSLYLTISPTSSSTSLEVVFALSGTWVDSSGGVLVPSAGLTPSSSELNSKIASFSGLGSLDSKLVDWIKQNNISSDLSSKFTQSLQAFLSSNLQAQTTKIEYWVIGSPASPTSLQGTQLFESQIDPNYSIPDFTLLRSSGAGLTPKPVFSNASPTLSANYYLAFYAPSSSAEFQVTALSFSSLDPLVFPSIPGNSIPAGIYDSEGVLVAIASSNNSATALSSLVSYPPLTGHLSASRSFAELTFALQVYDAMHYRQAIPLFRKFNDLYPGSQLSASYELNSHERILAQKDRTPNSVCLAPLNCTT